MRLIVGSRSFGPEDAVHRIDESGFVWAVATLGALIECYQKHHHVGIFGDVSLESIANNVPNLVYSIFPAAINDKLPKEFLKALAKLPQQPPASRLTIESEDGVPTKILFELIRD